MVDNAARKFDLRGSIDELKDRPYKLLSVVEKASESTIRRSDEDGTTLQCAVKTVVKGVVPVCDRLISKGKMDPLQTGGGMASPIKIAIDGGKDTLAAMLVRKSDKARVRDQMLRSREINVRDTIKKNMQKTTIALLDCLSQESDEYGDLKMTHSYLDADKQGNTPIDKKYNKKQRSALQLMVDKRQKDILHHPVVHAILTKKWNDYGRKQFVCMFFFYLISLGCLTFSMWSAVFTTDVRSYNSRLDAARLVNEIIASLCVIGTVIEEIAQFCVCPKCRKNEKRGDTADTVMSFLRSFTRYIDLGKHWYIFAVGYQLWVFRILKFAALNRDMALYIGLLWQLMYDVFPKFAVLFIVQILAFGGAFLLTLKGDMNLDVHNETSSFEMIMLTGFRTLAEGGPVVEDYLGDGGYRFASSVVMLMFIFMIIVVLLNILIAQLTDQLPKSRDEVDKNVTFKRAQVIHSIDSNLWHLTHVFHITNCMKDKTSAEDKYFTKDDIDNMLTDFDKL